MTQDTPKTSGETLIEKMEEAKLRKSVFMGYVYSDILAFNNGLDAAIKIVRKHEPEQEVLKYRGSCDAPGFDACVESEKKQALEEITDAEMDDDDPIGDAYAKGYADGYRAKAISIRQEAAQDRICIGGRWYVPEEQWQPIDMDPKDGRFRFYGCEVKFKGGGFVFWDAFYLSINEDGELVTASGDPFSDWEYEDFTHFADVSLAPEIEGQK